MGFGKPNSGSGNGTRSYKVAPKTLKEGPPLVVRILPPILSCETSGEWAVPHTSHFGYMLPSDNDPNKKFPVPFYCMETIRWENRQRVIVQHCPECDHRADVQADYDAQMAVMKKQGVPEETIRETLKPICDFLKNHNRSFKYYINVKSDAGEFYTLQFPNSLKKDLDSLRKKYQDEQKLDILDAEQGVWLIISTSGKGFQKASKIDVVQDPVMINGSRFQQLRPAPLTEADSAAAEASCRDLYDVGIRELSLEKVKMLVDSCGDEEIVWSVFSASEQKTPARENAPEPVSAPVAVKPAPTPAPVVVAAPKPAPAPVVVVPVASPAPVVEEVEEDEVAKAMAALAAAQAAKKAKAAKPASAAAPVAAVVVPTPVVQPAASAEMSEEDFLSQFKF